MFPCSTFSILTTRKISGCGFVTEKIPWGKMTSVRYFYATYIWLFGNCYLVVWRVQNVDIQHRIMSRILGIGRRTFLLLGRLSETGSSYIQPRLGLNSKQSSWPCHLRAGALVSRPVPACPEGNAGRFQCSFPNACRSCFLTSTSPVFSPKYTSHYAAKLLLFGCFAS